MPRIKRTSAEFEKADMRLQNLTSISATLDLGNGFSVAAFEAKIKSAQTTLNEYNQLLAILDEKNRAREKPSDRRPIAETAFAGDFPA